MPILDYLLVYIDNDLSLEMMLLQITEMKVS